MEAYCPVYIIFQNEDSGYNKIIFISIQKLVNDRVYISSFQT